MNKIIIYKWHWIYDIHIDSLNLFATASIFVCNCFYKFLFAIVRLLIKIFVLLIFLGLHIFHFQIHIFFMIRFNFSFYLSELEWICKRLFQSHSIIFIERLSGTFFLNVIHIFWYVGFPFFHYHQVTTLTWDSQKWFLKKSHFHSKSALFFHFFFITSQL